MVTTISVHIVQPGKFDTAIDTFKKNTVMARKQNGFVSRHILTSLKDPNRITTVTKWKSKADQDAWMSNKSRPGSPPGTYVSVVSEHYTDEAQP